MYTIRLFKDGEFVRDVQTEHPGVRAMDWDNNVYEYVALVQETDTIIASCGTPKDGRAFGRALAEAEAAK